MSSGVCALQSSIGKKAVMAVTGLLLLGFVIAHLLGNLLIFMGPEALNAYALKLRKLGPGLWVLRIGLLAIFTAHVLSAIRLTIENKKARPIAYASKKTIETGYAARTMMISGVLVLVYLIFHLMHFTWRVTHPEISHLSDAAGHHDVYSMVVLSFQQWPIVLIYVVSIAILCSHLAHGIASLFQSLGLSNDKWIPIHKRAGQAVAGLIFIGYVSIPLSVLFGWVQAAGGAS